MHDDPIKALLDEADIAPAAPRGGPLKLASDVRALHRLRMHRKLVLAATGIVVVGILLSQSLPRANDGPRDQLPKGTPNIAELQNAVAQPDLAQALKQIDREQQILDQLLLAERRHQLEAQAQELGISPERQVRLDEQVGRAALAILLPADEKRLRPELQASARQDYASVIDLFPHSQWSATAKQRLAGLGP